MTKAHYYRYLFYDTVAASILFILRFINLFMIQGCVSNTTNFISLHFSSLFTAFVNSASLTIASSYSLKSFAITQSVGHMIDKLFEFDLRRFLLFTGRHGMKHGFNLKSQMLSIHLKDQRLISISKYNMIFTPYIVFPTNKCTNCTQTFESIMDGCYTTQVLLIWNIVLQFCCIKF